jgi:hypothetical protein
MFKSILGVGFYFIAMLLVSYYFIGISFIKALQMTSLITILHVFMLFIDRLYKRCTKKL